MNKPIDKERWAQLNIFQQMGNIGSEVGRAIKAKREGILHISLSRAA
ncbi:MAG: hypothetical protein LBC49_00435 [Bacteroidales bacterium]|jgi:hypothetical protein|nr:hypothetical protein [Bacteroidales bacterium]